MTAANQSETPRQDAAATVERRWGAVSLGILGILVFLATFAGVHQATMPQARVETVDPTTLHIAGEFIESNLGSAVEPDGSVTVRLVGQQYSFTPQCILVPTETLVTFRAASAEVIHGFLIQNTNVNLMLVPGYVSTISARFAAPAESLMPCHEYCGTGHEGMWAHVRIIEKAEFLKLAQQRRRLTCVAQ
ncbi:MAG: cytochrome C oxidase subunit II [Steroidobacteraceae bacterium]